MNTQALEIEKLFHLATDHYHAGRQKQAENVLTRIQKRRPDIPEVLHLLSVIALQTDRPQAARAHLEKIVTLQPGAAAPKHLLGVALMRQGRTEAAIAAIEHAIAIDPDLADAHYNLGNALRETNRFEDAASHYETAINLEPDFTDAIFNLGRTRAKQGRVEDAEDCFRRVLALHPGDGEAYFNLGNLLRDNGRVAEALSAFRRAVQCNPKDIEAIKNLGNLLSSLNRVEDAIDTFRVGLKIDPDNAGLYGSIVLIKDFDSIDDDVRAMEGLLDRTALEADKVILNSALGKAYKDLDDIDRSFHFFAEACRTKRATMTFDIAYHEDYMARIADTFTSDFVNGRAGSGNRSPVPIFILGMPRSGTTLVEQILSSHSQVFGGGELYFVHELTAALGENRKRQASFPEIATDLNADEISAFGDRYIQKLQALAPDKPHVADKMLENFYYLGLIRLALPNAAIIHCRRDPVDTCLSCFNTQFSEGLAYTYELRELGRFFRAYARLMDHWHAVFPGGILDIRYEDMIADQETETRRLLTFCGLDWEDGCLEYYNTERTVWTASAAQVRKPLYRTSIKRWKRYEKHLIPLIETLGPLVHGN